MISDNQRLTAVDYLQFGQLALFGESHGLKHAVFPRSDEDGNSLNVSFAIPGADEKQVTELRESLIEMLGFEQYVDCNQVHGDRVVYVKDAVFAGDADGLITDKRDLALMIKIADCQPVFFFAPERGVVGLAHCGWKGLKNGIIEQMLKSFAEQFGVAAKDLFVAIGPSIGACCAEFSDPYNELPERFHPFIDQDNYVDLWEATFSFLMKEGVLEERIEVSGLCTACDNQDWFSYRRDKEFNQGRFAAVIGLNDEIL